VTSAQGIDISAYQSVVTAAQLDGLTFAFAKATNGAYVTDPHFAANWAVIKTAGKIRGAYHELTPGDARGQAAHFLAVVRAAGLQPGDMLAVSVSDYKEVTDGEARAWLDAVTEGTGGRNPAVCYTDRSVGANLPSCAGYPLWIAWPASAAPESVAPWGSWHLWQWDMTSQDRDSFNGTPAEMAAWIATYAKAAPAPAPAPPTEHVEIDMVKVPVLKQGSTGQAVRNWQGILVAHAYGYLIAPDPGSSVEEKSGVDGQFGSKTAKATVAFQTAMKLPATGVVGKAEWEAALGG
jgi:lysozyme